MNKETLDKATLFSSMDETVTQLLSLMSSLNENSINQIPYNNSWTAAMVFSHITKSTNGIAKVLEMPAKPAERNIDARVPDLKELFLDFSKKMQSPDFIEPEKGVYQKQETIEKLTRSFERLKESAHGANMGNVIHDLPFGEVTVLELLHFVLYHTQRHLHQMQKICNALNSK